MTGKTPRKTTGKKSAKVAKKAAAKSTDNMSAARQIEKKIAELGDWRGEMLSRLRAVIQQADPDVVEAVKWRKPSNPAGVPVWEHTGIICTGDAFKGKVKLTFAKGASLEDPSGLFNASLEGNAMRAIDFHEGDTINAKALKALIRAAISLNKSLKKERQERST